MKRLFLGRTGQSVSILGLGCAGMSHAYGPAKDPQSLATMQTALDHGIDLFDTADVYGSGHNETLVGRFIRKVGRNRVVIATKFGMIPSTAEGTRRIDNSPGYITEACNASLKRLGIETIDLYYMHRRDPAVPIAESVGAMSRLVDAGKVRWLGLSEVAATTLREAHAVHPIAALQSEYSLWTRDPEGAVLDACRELRVTFVPFGPLGRAFLTGTLEASRLSASDFRAKLPRFQGARAEQNQALVELLAQFARRRHATAAQIALAWLLAKNNGEQTVLPIPGTKRPTYVAENVAATEIHLTPDEVSELESIFAPDAIKGPRYPSEDTVHVGT